MNSKRISNWLRQTRYRARKNLIDSDIEIDDVQEIIRFYKNSCAYCENIADSIDCVFALSSGSPHVPANALPICEECKEYKKSSNIIAMYVSGRITEEKYLLLLSQMFDRRGGEVIRNLVKKLSGIADE